MAERRMFSKKIVSSARFLRMPASTRELYFQLGINADDDGVAEAFTVMRQVGATEDDLHVLVAKGFVKVLDDDLVTYIIDWRENNRLRADRKVDSMYKDLLLKMVPDVELLPSRTRADVTPHGPHTDNRGSSNGRPVDSPPSGHGRDTDNQRTEEGSVVEVSVVEGSTGEVNGMDGGMEDNSQSDSTKTLMTAWDSLDQSMVAQMTLYREQIGESLLNHSVRYMITHQVTAAGVPKYLASMVERWDREGITTVEQAERYEQDRIKKPHPVPDSSIPDIPIVKLTD